MKLGYQDVDRKVERHASPLQQQPAAVLIQVSESTDVEKGRCVFKGSELGERRRASKREHVPPCALCAVQELGSLSFPV